MADHGGGFPVAPPPLLSQRSGAPPLSPPPSSPPNSPPPSSSLSAFPSSYSNNSLSLPYSTTTPSSPLPYSNQSLPYSSLSNPSSSLSPYSTTTSSDPDVKRSLPPGSASPTFPAYAPSPLSTPSPLGVGGTFFSKSPPLFVEKKETVVAPTVKEDSDRANHFMSQAFTYVDGLLLSLALMNKDHPLAPALTEGSLFIRELLNCWTVRELHEVAVESLQERVEVMSGVVKSFAQRAPLKLQGPAEVETLSADGRRSLGAVKKGILSARLNSLYHSASKKGPQVKLFDLRSVVYIQQLHQGKDAEFIVSAHDLGPGHVPNTETTVKKFQIRVPTDLDRQRWMSLLHTYKERSAAKLALKRLSIPQQIQLYTQRIYTTFSTEATNKSLEFLYATDRLQTVNAQDSKEKEEAIVGIKDRFVVEKVTTFGKVGTTREIEIDLSGPAHKLTIYHLDEGKRNDVITFTRKDLIDYKLYDGNRLELSFWTRKINPDVPVQSNFSNLSQSSPTGLSTGEEGTRWQRKYGFPNAKKLQKFLDLLVLFQHPPRIERFDYLYEDVVEIMSHRTQLFISEPHADAAASADRIEEKGDVFNGVVHELLMSMNASAQLNMPCRQLVTLSKTSSLTPQGDIERLRPLCAYFESLIALNETYQCQCLLNKCLLLLLRAFLYNQGYIAMHYLLNNSDSQVQTLSLKIIWQAFRLKHMVSRCTGKLDVFVGAPQHLVANPTPSSDSTPTPQTDLKAKTGDDEMEIHEGGGLDPNSWSPTGRFPFSWYVETMALKNPVSYDVIHALLESLLALNPLSSQKIEQKEGGVGGSDLFIFPESVPTTPPTTLVEGLNEQELIAYNVASKQIKEGSLLPVICLAVHYAQSEARNLGLISLLATVLFSGNPQQFFIRRGWQTWLFPFLLDQTTSEPDPVAQGRGRGLSVVIPKELPPVKILPNSVSYARAMSILAQLHLAALNNTPAPTKDVVRSCVLWKTIALTQQFTKWTCESRYFIRRLCFTLIRIIIDKAKSVASDVDSLNLIEIWDKWENLFHLLTVMEEFIFYLPTPGCAAGTLSGGASKNNEWGVEIDTQWKDMLVDATLLDHIVDLLATITNLLQQRSKACGNNQPKGLKELTTKALSELEYFNSVRIVVREAIAVATKDNELLIKLAALAKLLTARNKSTRVMLHRKKAKVIVAKTAPQSNPGQQKRFTADISVRPPVASPSISSSASSTSSSNSSFSSTPASAFNTPEKRPSLKQPVSGPPLPSRPSNSVNSNSDSVPEGTPVYGRNSSGFVPPPLTREETVTAVPWELEPPLAPPLSETAGEEGGTEPQDTSGGDVEGSGGYIGEGEGQILEGQVVGEVGEGQERAEGM